MICEVVPVFLKEKIHLRRKAEAYLHYPSVSKEFITIFLLIRAGFDEIIFLEQRQLFQRLHSFRRSYIRVAGYPVGGLYQNIAGLFRQYEVNEGFGSFIIGMILNLAYRQVVQPAWS